MRATDFVEFSRSNSVFSGMSAMEAADFNLTGAGEPERLYGARVSANLFSLLGAQPERGRGFLPEEDQPGRDRVVVISHELWMRRLGGDPGILNRTLSLNGQPHLVVGIMPAGIPLSHRQATSSPGGLGAAHRHLETHGLHPGRDLLGRQLELGVIARLKPGVSATVAEQQLNVIAQSIVQRVRKQVPGAGV